ncbi:hypothetical protein [Hyalangium versicolor]|uniref:hypothetical protein n=1 Tax=Hyalangium versicolor TaxID=2861190 RepID=UPI001CCED187|nr:hypothetical protein [Hyalangium versicolor]
MPTEVLVMCTRCGRPQPARPGNCMACGEALPDAPLPGGTEAPFLQLEGTWGRSVIGVDRKLKYLLGPSATPFVVELSNVRSAALVRSSPWWVLGLVLGAIVLGFVVPSLRWMAGTLAVLGVLAVGLLQRYSLRLLMIDGRKLRWVLGWSWLGSQRLGTVEHAWSSGAQALASRGVSVTDGSGDASGSSGSGA